MIIDLSHHNTVTDWAAVRAAGVIGVLHKFSQGRDYRDPAYAGRVDAAKAAGLMWGRYHFADATPVARQIANFLEGWHEDEAIALDWEDNAENQMPWWRAIDFVAEVRVQTGVLPILYSGNTLKEAMQRKVADAGILTECRLWLAQYGPHAVLPLGFAGWWLWQYSSEGTVPGITGPVDVNRYHDEAELRTTWAPRPVVVA